MEARELRIELHPQKHMRQLGYDFKRSQPEPIGDCWFFEVEKIIEPLPKFLKPSNYKFD